MLLMSLDWLVPNVTHVSGLTCTQLGTSQSRDISHIGYRLIQRLEKHWVQVNPETWATLGTSQSRDMSNIGYMSIQRHESQIDLYPMLLMSLDCLVSNVTHVSGLTCIQCYSCLWMDLYPMLLMSLDWLVPNVTHVSSQSRDMSNIGYKSIQRHESHWVQVNPETWVTLGTSQSRDMSNIGCL
jgi:hypothetical protein